LWRSVQTDGAPQSHAHNGIVRKRESSSGKTAAGRAISAKMGKEGPRGNTERADETDDRNTQMSTLAPTIR